VAVELSADPRLDKARTQLLELKPERGGYFSGTAPQAAPGMFYKFKLPGGSFPDPASRFQPAGPHGPSEIVDPGRFRWTDRWWKGVSRQGQVIYELHIGTFTREGNWTAAREQLPELARLGVTLVEVMPVADFPGSFGWGYDGVNLFAPTRLYGRPDDFRAFVDRAHKLGLGVILDVVYNHLGPDGNYLGHFSEDYRSKRYKTEWGDALNFDGRNCQPVREFFIANAAYWIDEFHLDGLRLDAVQQIFDASSEHIVLAVGRAARKAARRRGIFVVAENEQPQVAVCLSPERGGCGLDAIWDDDFHNSAFVALTGRSEAYYVDYKGTPQELVSVVKHGFLLRGRWYARRQLRRGTSVLGLTPEQFVFFLENHDQVANTWRGSRLHQFSAPGQLRALTALLLLGPATPMLFQGQEFGASAPFVYFADHKSHLAKRVAAGRKSYLKKFPTVAISGADGPLDAPHDEATFHKCKLDLSERARNGATYALHADLVKLRRQDPVLSRPKPGKVDGAVLGRGAFALRFFGEKGDDRLLLVNLGADLPPNPSREPLLTPVQGRSWSIKWSSENPRYGGGGTKRLGTNANWRVLGHAAVLLVPA
jgi:maltooligosyltrehalose trehalohydrolase